MRKSTAVIDTNVLYAGLYSKTGASHQLLLKIDQGFLIPVLSTTLLFEYEDLLRRHQKILSLSDRAIENVLEGLCARGKAQAIHFLWRPQLSNPKDDHVLELAVAAGGPNIITHNTRDFKGSEAFGIKIKTPSTYLGEIK